MKASIIITTYNRLLFLKRAIESSLNQATNYSYEVIVVDDNGTDTPLQKETALVVSAYPALKYIPLLHNMGACTARNEGVKQATGEYIFFLDDDDEYFPLKIEKQISFLENNHQADACAAAFKRVQYETGKEINAESNYPKIGSYKEFVLHGIFFTPMLCIRKNSFSKINGFDDIPRFQDMYLMLKMLENGFSVECINEPLHVMYEHNDGRITNTNIGRSEAALRIIGERVQTNKKLFTASEWKAYQINGIRMRAMFYYISPNYKTRLKSIKYYICAFSKSFRFGDMVMIIKAILKN